MCPSIYLSEIEFAQKLTIDALIGSYSLKVNDPCHFEVATECVV